MWYQVQHKTQEECKTAADQLLIVLNGSCDLDQAQRNKEARLSIDYPDKRKKNRWLVKEH